MHLNNIFHKLKNVKHLTKTRNLYILLSCQAIAPIEKCWQENLLNTALHFLQLSIVEFGNLTKQIYAIVP